MLCSCIVVVVCCLFVMLCFVMHGCVLSSFVCDYVCAVLLCVFEVCVCLV